jgi:hypothetical protein
MPNTIVVDYKCAFSGTHFIRHVSEQVSPSEDPEARLAVGPTFCSGVCTGGSQLWFPTLRLAFQKSHLVPRQATFALPY